MKRAAVVLAVVLSVLCSQAALATPDHVSIDLSGLGGADFQLQAALYDNSGVIGDSWALMDNVTLRATVDDFETGALGGFNNSLNPTSVIVVPGNLNSTGSYLMRINEDPVFTPTIAFRDYSGPTGSVLMFDLDLVTSGRSGPMGKDELVLSLLNPQTLDPLVSGLTGVGDMLVASASGIEHTNAVAVTATQIPAPAALMLGLIGLGGLRLWRRQSRWL